MIKIGDITPPCLTPISSLEWVDIILPKWTNAGIFVARIRSSKTSRTH